MFPEHIGRYEIKTEIGRGGMATVYLAHDPRVKRDVAIKILPAHFLHDPTFRTRFEREAQIIASLEHAAIVPVYDFGEEQGLPYIVMRYMPGGTLSDRLKSGPLSLTETAHILSRLAPALDEAHARGIIHRDLKPSNILFDQRGEAFLTDFGIAHMAQATTALTGSNIVGTPAYMSPEQARGDSPLDGRSDIYALGIILFEMLTGRQPYQATTPMGIVLKHLTEPPPRLQDLKADLPQETQAVITRAMAKEPAERFASASELAAAQQAVASLPSRPAAAAVSPHKGTPPPQPPPTARPVTPHASPSAVSVPSHQVSGPPRAASPRRGRIPLWAWAAGGLVLLAGACALSSLLMAGMGLFPVTRSQTTPSPAQTEAILETVEPQTLPPAQPDGVFRDDFSDPTSGWERSNLPEGRLDYEAGGYRIFIDRPQMMLWSTSGRAFGDVSVEVDVQKIAGADDNYFGVLCRYQDEDNFYLLWISSDGYYGIEKLKNGEFTPPGDTAHGYHQVIHQGKTTNHLRADCVGDTLTLYANETRLATLDDREFTQGEVGLLARSTDLAGTNLLFDNFVARER